jgi:hypothetical protein
MSYQANNTYGLQKVKEIEPRDGLDSAINVAGTAGKFASIGAKYGGKWGALGAGAIGAGYSLIKEKQMRRNEEILQSQQESYNKAVDNLEDTRLRTNTMISQARYGMKTGNKEVVEIEGDGGGNKGELVFDKNFNLKYNAKGMPKHENGGVKVNVETGDSIFNTQNDKRKYDKVMDLYKRYKLRGDMKAKKQLEKMREQLPDKPSNAKELGMARYGMKKYDEGGNVGEVLKRKGDPYEYMYKDGKYLTRKAGSDDEFQDMESNENLKGGISTLEKEFGFKQGEDRKLEPVDFESQEGYSGAAATTDGYIDPYLKKAADEGIPVVLKNGKSNVKGVQDPFDKNTGETSRRTIPEEVTKELREDWNEEEEMEEVTDPKYIRRSNRNARRIAKGKETKDIYGNRLKDATDKIKDKAKDIKDKSKSVTDRFTGGSNNDFIDYNTLYNLKKGSETPDRVARRYASPKYLDFKSRTAEQERMADSTEAMQRRMMRGKALPQATAYSSQFADQRRKYLGSVYQQESQRADQVDQYNVNLQNQTNQQNIARADQYDIADAQNKAATEAFMGEAARGATTKGQFDAQMRYMQSRDAKQRDMDMYATKFLGSRNYRVDPTQGVLYNETPTSQTPEMTREEWEAKGKELGYGEKGYYKRDTKEPSVVAETSTHYILSNGSKVKK